MPKIKISQDDIDSLLDCGEEFCIGATRIPIVPLPLRALPGIIKDIVFIRDNLMGIVKERQGNWGASIAPIAELIITRAPSIAAEMANIEVTDFQKLPAGSALDLVVTCIDVNLVASGDMIKKLVALAGRSTDLINNWQALKGSDQQKTD